jgi:hypothetical protein
MERGHCVRIVLVVSCVGKSLHSYKLLRYCNGLPPGPSLQERIKHGTLAML